LLFDQRTDRAQRNCKVPGTDDLAPKHFLPRMQLDYDRIYGRLDTVSPGGE
jgi:hypothetical protein